jgi:cytochrome P450
VADERNHARQRRILPHAFSTKALKRQEELIIDFVDLFILKIRETTENCKEPIDINKWYDYLAFDVIGELTFGETFGCMATGKLLESSKAVPIAQQLNLISIQELITFGCPTWATIWSLLR